MVYCILAVYLLYTYCYIYFNLVERVEIRIPIESPHIDSVVNFDTRLHSNKHFLSIEARRSLIEVEMKNSYRLCFQFSIESQ